MEKLVQLMKEGEDPEAVLGLIKQSANQKEANENGYHAQPKENAPKNVGNESSTSSRDKESESHLKKGTISATETVSAGNAKSISVLNQSEKSSSETNEKQRNLPKTVPDPNDPDIIPETPEMFADSPAVLDDSHDSDYFPDMDLLESESSLPGTPAR